MKKVLFLFFIFFVNILPSKIYADHFLTFIIPCYNCEPWIEKTIESIFQQNLNCPYEIICTDDGSNDRTLQILSKLAHNHSQLKVIRHAKNRGGGSARNTCVQNSQGDIIFCLDSDNILAPNSIQILIDYMDQTGSDIVSFGGLNYFINDCEIVGTLKYNTESQKYSLTDILQHADSPAWSGNYLYTKRSFEIANGYPESWGCLDTFTFGFMQLLHGFEIAYVPNTFYWHRHGIESYYIREARSKKIDINFFRFLIQFDYLFTDRTVFLLKQQLNYYNSHGRVLHDMIWFFVNKKIELK